MTSGKPKQKVICLGLGRTGTQSLRDALQSLGYGPCYHMRTIVAEGSGKDIPVWCKIGDGKGTSEDLRFILQDYGAALDYPMVMYAAQVYAAYPDAKYILTTRDPAKWEISMKATILRMGHARLTLRSRTPLEKELRTFHHTMQEKYHRGRIFTHTQQEFLDHNERIKKLIPPENLLIYEVGEGWERLVEFLGVPMPTAPFPHVNEAAEFQKDLLKLEARFRTGRPAGDEEGDA